MSRPKRLASAADSGGKKESYDIPYTPPPPCEVGGRCRFFDTCKHEHLACLDFSRYNHTGENWRTDPAPNAYIFDSIYPGVREQENSDGRT